MTRRTFLATGVAASTAAAQQNAGYVDIDFGREIFPESGFPPADRRGRRWWPAVSGSPEIRATWARKGERIVVRNA